MEKRAHKSPADYLKALFSNPFTLLWLGGMLAMIIASLMPQGGLSEMETGFGRDKVVRVITFLLLSFYPVAFFPSIRMGLIISTFIAPLGFLLEVFQKYVPGRNFSPEDMIANNIGAIIGISLALAIRFYFRTGQLKFRKNGGHTPRAALVPEEDSSHSPDNETKENGFHQASLKGSKSSSPRRFKRWRSKAIILGLLLVLGYVGWTIIMDQTRQKNPDKNPQPESKTSSEQTVTQTEAKPDLTEPRGGKKGTENIVQSSTVFPHPPVDTVALSEPEPKVSTSEVDGTNKTEPDATPPPTKTPSPEISTSTLTTTPEPDLMETPHINEDPPQSTIEGNIEKPATQSSVEEKPDPIPEISAPSFSIRAGAFLEKQNAEKLVMDLKTKGYQPYIFVATDKKNRTWYAVQLSDHTDLDQAGIAAAIFRKKEKKRVYITHKDSLKTVPGLSTR